MSWIPFTYVWIFKLMVLAVVVGLVIETVVRNSKKLQDLTLSLLTSSEKVQFLVGKIDKEFDVLNSRAKLIKLVVLNLGTFYKELAAGSMSLEEVIRESKTVTPSEMRTQSSFFNKMMSSSSDLSAVLDGHLRETASLNFSEVPCS